VGANDGLLTKIDCLSSAHRYHNNYQSETIL
jgi:hypothetical protein